MGAQRKTFTKSPCQFCGDMISNCGFAANAHWAKHRRKGDAFIAKDVGAHQNCESAYGQGRLLRTRFGKMFCSLCGKVENRCDIRGMEGIADLCENCGNPKNNHGLYGKGECEYTGGNADIRRGTRFKKMTDECIIKFLKENGCIKLDGDQK